MDKSQNVVTFGNAVNNHADGVNVVNFFKLLALNIHFAVYSVDRFYASLYGQILYRIAELFAQHAFYALDIRKAVFFISFKQTLDFIICDKVKVLNRQIFKLLFYRTDT